MEFPIGSQRPIHLGPRPKLLPRSEGYQNIPLDRDFATDIVIEAGEALTCEGGQTRIEIIPSGAGYDVRMPVEHLAGILASLFQLAAPR